MVKENKDIERKITYLLFHFAGVAYDYKRTNPEMYKRYQSYATRARNLLRNYV